MDEPRWVSRSSVEILHTRLIDLYGGADGVRDSSLVDSALARPVHRWSYEPGCDLASLAASYAYGLAKNHGFVDGNKRVAFAVMGVFLIRNGFLLDVPEEEATRLMFEVAAGERTEAELTEWLRQHVVPVAAG
jgi:death-on-curing protein